MSEASQLRPSIESSWPKRHGHLASRARRIGPQAPVTGLRQELFTQIVQRADRSGTGAITRDRIRAYIEEWRAGLPPLAAIVSTETLEQDMVDEISGLGPLGRLMRDPTVSDVLVNGPEEIWIDRFGRLEKTPLRFDDEAHLRRVIRRVVAAQGRRIDDTAPCVDVRLGDGSRLNAVLAPVSVGGTTVSIRRSRETPLRFDDLIAFGTLTREMADVLVAAIRGRLNIVIAGGGGAGKTTLLSVLAREVPATERIVTIEETSELRIEHPHVVTLESRIANAEGVGGVDLRTLVKNALRMRADRIIVGEVRGAEAFEMLQAMHIGHDGSLTTIHANSSRDALRRLETLVVTAGDLPSEAVREIVTSAVHVVVQMARLSDGMRRIISISLVDHESQEVNVRDLFTYDHASGTFETTPTGHEFVRRLRGRQEKE
jgi:pilus assembly protein CpaF